MTETNRTPPDVIEAQTDSVRLPTEDCRGAASPSTEWTRAFRQRVASFDGFHMAIVFAVLLAVYLLTMPFKVCLADSGLFLMASTFYGVAHPPGYPLYTIVGHLAASIPIGDIPFRIHLVSALFGAATCSLLWLVCRRLNTSLVAAYAAALSFGVSAAFWSQAIIPEVYTLNTFFFFLLLNLALAFRETGSRGLAVWTAFIFGLSLANHWPLIILAAPCWLFILWPKRGDFLRSVPKLTAVFAVGLLPYGSMVVRSHIDPVINFYGPIRSLRMFWFFVSRQGYSGSSTGDLVDCLKFAAFTTNEIILQFTIVGCAVVVIGFWQLKQNVRRLVFVALVWAVLSNSYFLLPLLRMRFDFMTQASFRVIPLVSYGVLAIALGAGFDWILTSAAVLKWRRHSAVILCFLLVGSIFFANLGSNDRRHYRYADDVARTILEVVERNAVLITTGDADTLPLGFLHHVEGVRPDVTIYNYDGLVFNNRIFDFYAASPSTLVESWNEFLNTNTRPVYALGGLFQDRPGWDYGLFRRLTATDEMGSMPPFPSRVLDLLDRIIVENPIDSQTIRARNRALFLCAIALNRSALTTEDEQVRQQLLPSIRRLDSLIHGKLGKATAGFGIWEADTLLRLLDEEEILSDETIGNWERAHFFYLRGLLHSSVGVDDRALSDWQRSLSFDGNPTSNKSVEMILKHHHLKQNREDFNRAKELYYPNGIPLDLQDLDTNRRQ